MIPTMIGDSLGYPGYTGCLSYDNLFDTGISRVKCKASGLR
jgi:hypothetical protein